MATGKSYNFPGKIYWGKFIGQEQDGADGVGGEARGDLQNPGLVAIRRGSALAGAVSITHQGCGFEEHDTPATGRLADGF